MKAEARYADVVKAFTGRPRVTNVDEGGGFGSRGQLKVDGRIFAMLVRGELVVKLPRGRVDELVDARHGRRFDAGKGKPMREWFALASTSRQAWLPLAQEAFDFVQEAKR
jgi:hypothetical protein